MLLSKVPDSAVSAGVFRTGINTHTAHSEFVAFFQTKSVTVIAAIFPLTMGSTGSKKTHSQMTNSARENETAADPIVKKFIIDFCQGGSVIVCCCCCC